MPRGFLGSVAGGGGEWQRAPESWGCRSPHTSLCASNTVVGPTVQMGVAQG